MDELIDATAALESAQRALADARARLTATDAKLAAEEARARELQHEFAATVGRGEDGKKAQDAWGKAREQGDRLKERREPQQAAIQKAQLDVLRAQLKLEQVRQTRQLCEAEELGRVGWEQVENLIGTVAELRALMVANNTSRSITIDTAKALDAPAPPWRTILWGSGLSVDTWDALSLLERAASSARSERQRIAAQQPVAVTSA